MKTLLEVVVPLSILIILLVTASAISNAIFVVLWGFVRFVRARISKKVGVRDRFRAAPSPTRAPKDRGALRSAARG
jgi:hypothetical protein